MKLLVLLFFLFVPSAWSAESVSQRTTAPCSPVVSGVKGNVDIKIANCKQGVDPARVKLILQLLNEGLPRIEEQQRQILEILASKVLDTKQLEEIIASKHAALFNSSQKDAAKWAKDLVESSKANEAELKSLALSGRELADKLTLKLKPGCDFILQEFDSRISELKKRGLLKPQQFSPDPSIEFIVVDESPRRDVVIRDIEFKNGAGMRIYLLQAQIHRGKLIGEPAIYFDESVDGARFQPLYFRLMSKQLRLRPEKTDMGTDHKPNTEDPLSDEEFLRKISIAIGDSISFIYLHDAASPRPR